ncbi:MAG: GNAT family N-acetyltransferase [Clostridia bacterium]|nr:GNAT family N-acetyltransferase [Clostridia bacterium]
MNDLKLVPITFLDAKWLDKTEYKNLTTTQREQLVKDSIGGKCRGEFFRFFLLKNGEIPIGVINMCGHGSEVVSVAPEIFEIYRNKGYGAKGLQIAYSIAKSLGFKKVTAGIRGENVASQKLHEKLGFTFIKKEFSKNGNLLYVYEKEL